MRGQNHFKASWKFGNCTYFLDRIARITDVPFTKMWPAGYTNAWEMWGEAELLQRNSRIAGQEMGHLAKYLWIDESCSWERTVISEWRVEFQESTARLWVRIPPGIRSVESSTFCPHSVFMCFVWLSEQTAIISLYSINWLGFYNRDLTLYSLVVTICTTSLSFNNSTFCPHSVFMCFVWIWEQTAIISLYNINWLVFITQI